MRIELITWVDASRVYSWTQIEEFKAIKLVVCQTVGFVVDEDDEMVRIASTFDNGEQINDGNLIPKPLIRDRKILRRR